MGARTGFPTRTFPHPGNIAAFQKWFAANIDVFRGLVGGGAVWYVDADNGSDGNNDGKSWESAFATMTPLDTLLGNGDTIFLRGVLRQQWTAPQDVFDVTIIGAANQARQATDSGTPTGGGATWLAPASPAATTALLTLREQAWRIINVFFVGHTDYAAVKLDNLETAVAASSGHASFYDCKFAGGKYGILNNGGAGFVTIQNCDFYNFATAGNIAIASISTTIALPLQWKICGCRFHNNVNSIVLPLSGSSIFENNFGYKGFTIDATVLLSLTGGKNNSVWNNMFNRPLDTSPNATLFVGGTNDVWSHNFGTDGIFYGVPDNS